MTIQLFQILVFQVLAGGNTPPDPLPPSWGPGTMWRIALLLMAVLIAALLLYRWLA